MRLAETKTILASLVGLHYASDEVSDIELMLFSEELRARNLFITGIGRYEHISGNGRELFETRMRKVGQSDFKLTEIDGTGRVSISSDRNYYHPTSSVEPRNTANVKLLGADIGASQELRAMIDDITAHNETIITAFPENWQTEGHLLLIRPVYQGMYAPATTSERVQRSAGGFWISVDIASLISAVNTQIKYFDVEVNIVSGGAARTVFSQTGLSGESVYFRSLYAPALYNKDWGIHSESFEVKLQQRPGFSALALQYTLATLICMVLATLLLTVYVVGRKKAILDSRASKDALFREREKAVTTLNTVQDAIITLDQNMRIVHINAATVVNFNVKLSDVIGNSLAGKFQFQKLGETNRIFDLEHALANPVHGGKMEFDVVPLGESQDDYVMRVSLSSSYAGDGVATGHVIVLRDISNERRLTNKLAYQAHHDSLTGCTNRLFFEQALGELLKKMPSSNATHALCYMDLDQFKVINDTCGHQAGDRLLIELTGNMRRVINDADVLSRLGGDEFGILMTNVSTEQARAFSQQVYDHFQNYIFHHEDKSFAIRASIGLVHIDQTCNNMKDVLARADIACYAAKDAGRNGMHVYSSTDDVMTERSMELGWLPRLQNALQNNEFRLHVQAVATVNPQFGHSEVEHFEFLLRLANPDGSVSTPWQFIQAAERYDLMRDIDKWVICNSLRIVSQLKTGPAKTCSFSINLSGQSAADPNLKDYIREQMECYAIDPSRIWFELTETAAISHFSVAVELISSLRDMGCKVALDDFGSGLSSFGYLKNLPVDVIKIDGQFVREIADNEVDHEMVKAIHQVGRSMGIRTVAEFVENQAILDTLKNIGIDYAQGYHIGKPCEIDIAMAQLSCRNRAA